MAENTRAEHVIRNAILALLSDDEIANVSSAESAARLSDGAEFIDLEQPAKGIQRSSPNMKVPMGEVLPRASVHKDTWTRIVARLAE